MKLMFMPTLSDMREMLGEDLYVKFVWMWREREQETRAAERRARFAAVTPKHDVHAWPTPAFARVAATAATVAPVHAFPPALLRGPRLAEGIDMGDLAGLIERVREEPREAAVAGRRRRR